MGVNSGTALVRCAAFLLQCTLIAYVALVFDSVRTQAVFLGLGSLVCLLLSVFVPRGVTRRLLLSTITAVFGLLVLELVSRALLSGTLYYRPHDILVRRYARLPLVSRYSPGKHYEGKAYGDMAALLGEPEFRVWRDVTFTTDEFGFRNALRSSEDAYSAIILGDSFGAGVGTSQEYILSSVLEKKYGIRSYNLSVPGNPWQSYVNLALEQDRIALKKGGTIVFLLFPGNDLDGYWGALDTDELPLLGWLGRRVFRVYGVVRRSPLLQIVRRIAGAGARRTSVLKVQGGERKTLFYDVYAKRRGMTPRDIQKHENYSALLGVLLGFHDKAKAWQAKFIVAVVPSKSQIYGWLLDPSPLPQWDKKESIMARSLSSFCIEHGIGLADLRPALTARAEELYNQSQELLYWDDDTHWNALGHEAVAECLYQHMFGGTNESVNVDKRR